ncbi:MAG: GNAT family N-acetyltransferase [Sulfitobacter sp.]|nr:GNAT family N-acetyltransferase [Sulfitobacter sp.]
MTPDLRKLLAVCEGTWPPARRWEGDGFILRDGQGGGQRVSAATATGPADTARIEAAAEAMRQIGQRPLFQLRDDETAFAAQLEAMGYVAKDPTLAYSLPIERLTDVPIPRVTAFTIWEPLAIMREIWATDGVGPERLAVMDRAACKTGVLARWNEKPGGVAYVGVYEGVAMVHALVVLPHQRRQGVAQWLMRAAAFWAQGQGAMHMSVLCVAANEPANKLYRALGFTPAGGYHYRVKPD